MMAGIAPRRDFWMRHYCLAMLAAGLLVALEQTAIDAAISGWFFDTAAGIFPLRYNPALEVLGHQWAKELVIVLACCVIAIYLLSFAMPELAPQRRLLLFLSLALTLAPMTVVLLKAASARNCPWSLQEFGGVAPHLSLFDAAPPGSLPGHCFPGGHASAGFCLFAFYFAGLELGIPRLARAGLWGGLAAGMALGMVRVAQGAHFLTHNLWSGVICWMVILSLYAAVVGPPADAGCAGPASR